MKVTIVSEKDANGEDCLTFYDSNNHELYCIRLRDLNGIEPVHKILDLDRFKFENILRQVLRVAKESWSSKELLTELTTIIRDRAPTMDSDIITETFLAIKLIDEINCLSDNFEKGNPPEFYPNTKYKNTSKWRTEFIKYLNDNNLPSKS
jgi:hypothetical protein